MFYDHPAIRPIKDLLLDPEISEIMINGPKQLFVERKGRMESLPARFADDRVLHMLVNRMLEPTGRSVSSASPYADFRLPDGSRVNVTIPPVALNGPTVTIRKFTGHLKKIEDLIKLGTLSKRMAYFLCAGVKGRLNIIFSGATGTGKTTTLGILSRHIPSSERIIAIEDTAELQLQQEHVIRLECRQPNQEGKGAVDMSQLVLNSLRMRPTRIIVGEIRGAEAIDMLQAIATGHDGCLAVLHASSPVDAISRLEMMALSRGLMLPLWAIHKQIGAAIDLIVQHEFLPDGTRKITRIAEVCGVRDDRIVIRDVFEYRRTGAGEDRREIGKWLCHGSESGAVERCRRRGAEIPPEVLGVDQDES